MYSLRCDGKIKDGVALSLASKEQVVCGKKKVCKQMECVYAMLITNSSQEGQMG